MDAKERTERRIELLREQMALKHVFYTSIMSRLNVTLSDKRPNGGPCPTACTNGENLVINPEFADRFDDAQLMAILIHECEHVARKHSLLARNIAKSIYGPGWEKEIEKRENRQKWNYLRVILNVAEDYVINCDVDEYENVTFKQGEWVFDKTYQGLSSLEAFERLRKEMKEQEEQYDQACKENNELADKILDALKKMMGVTGDDVDPTQEADYTKVEMEIDRAQAECEQLQRIQERAEKSRGLEAAAAQRQPGFCKPPTFEPWENVLSRFLEQHGGRRDYTYRKCSRLSLQAKVFYPALGGSEPQRGLFAIDTSGSMGDGELRIILGQIKRLLETYPSLDGRVVFCDTSATKPVPINQAFTVDIPRGGTSYNEPLRIAEKMHAKFVVYFTDGYGDNPSPPRGIPVIWMLTREGECSAKFGTKHQMRSFKYYWNAQ